MEQLLLGTLLSVGQKAVTEVVNVLPLPKSILRGKGRGKPKASKPPALSDTQQIMVAVVLAVALWIEQGGWGDWKSLLLILLGQQGGYQLAVRPMSNALLRPEN